MKNYYYILLQRIHYVLLVPFCPKQIRNEQNSSEDSEKSDRNEQSEDSDDVHQRPITSFVFEVLGLCRHRHPIGRNINHTSSKKICSEKSNRNEQSEDSWKRPVDSSEQRQYDIRFPSFGPLLSSKSTTHPKQEDLQDRRLFRIQKRHLTFLTSHSHFIGYTYNTHRYR